MEDRIVLGFPYTGAFLWLISAEEHYHKSIRDKYDGDNPYYKTLFGKRHNILINETVSLTLLFDEIYLAPVDVFLPERKIHTIGRAYSNQKLGIYSSTDWDNDFLKIREQINELLKDSIISDILKRVPKNAKGQILAGHRNNAYLN